VNSRAYRRPWRPDLSTCGRGGRCQWERIPGESTTAWARSTRRTRTGARVYGELDRLSTEELDTLARLLRGDTGQLLDRIDAARARALPTREDET